MLTLLLKKNNGKIVNIGGKTNMKFGLLDIKDN